MAMVGVVSGSLYRRTHSLYVVWLGLGSAAAWRHSTFIKWTGWTFAMALPWWQHHKHCLGYYHYYYYYWSATKQRLPPQSVAEISRHSVLSGQDSTMWHVVCISPQGHRSVSVSRHFLLQAPQCQFRAKTVQQRPLLPRKVKTRLPDCGVAH